MNRIDIGEKLAKVINLIKKYGPHSEEVRDYIISHKSASNHKEFEELAATCIYLAEELANGTIE